ncbi:Uu.00g099480.m01.CDS01 [Anthostomella pinea]|uniref:Uu.00g099480.m01.CDS01 n=1 Tax=Anthostomella pinea TaxID=933095 RepID=A0AAI8VCN8_9PEZI|nr:Uu.00g099480.m01.CDS01 [Anthostomella pinea]
MSHEHIKHLQSHGRTTVSQMALETPTRDAQCVVELGTTWATRQSNDTSPARDSRQARLAAQARLRAPGSAGYGRSWPKPPTSSSTGSPASEQRPSSRPRPTAPSSAAYSRSAEPTPWESPSPPCAPDSGGHSNPTITLDFAFAQGFPGARCLCTSSARSAAP